MLIELRTSTLSLWKKWPLAILPMPKLYSFFHFCHFIADVAVDCRSSTHVSKHALLDAQTRKTKHGAPNTAQKKWEVFLDLRASDFGGRVARRSRLTLVSRQFYSPLSLKGRLRGGQRMGCRSVSVLCPENLGKIPNALCHTCSVWSSSFAAMGF
jgi:hypothetical protein